MLVLLLFPASHSGSVCVCAPALWVLAPRPWETLGVKMLLHKVKDQDFLPSLTCFSWAPGGYEDRRVGSHLYHPCVVVVWGHPGRN